MFENKRKRSYNNSLSCWNWIHVFATTSSVSWGFLFSLVFFFVVVVDLVAIFASFFVSFRTQQSNNSQEVIVLDWDALNIMDSKKYSLRPSRLWLKYHVIIIISSSLLFLHNFFLSLSCQVGVWYASLFPISPKKTPPLIWDWWHSHQTYHKVPQRHHPTLVTSGINATSGLRSLREKRDFWKKTTI